MTSSYLSSSLGGPGSLSQQQRAKEKNSIIVLEEEEEEEDDESLLGGLAELVPRVMDHTIMGNIYGSSSSSSSNDSHEGDALSFTRKMPNMAHHRELLRRNILPMSEYAGSEVDGDWDYDDIAAFGGNVSHSQSGTTTSNSLVGDTNNMHITSTLAARSSSPYSHQSSSCRHSPYHSQRSIMDDDDNDEDPHTQNHGWSTRRVNLQSSTSRDILVSSDSTKSLHETKVNLDYSSVFQDMLAVHSTSIHTTTSSLHDCDDNIEVNCVYLSNHHQKEDPKSNQDTRNTNNAMVERSLLAHTPLLSEEEGGGIEIVATRSTTRNNNDDDDENENDNVHEPESVKDNGSLEEDIDPEEETDTMAKKSRTTRQDSFHKSDNNSSEKSNESESSSVVEDDSASTCLRKKMEQQESRTFEKREEDSVAESYNEYGENQYLHESSVASFTTMTGSHAFLERNKTPISLPTFKPATGCTNASDFVVRCIASRLRGGVAVIKHGRSRWCRSRMRLLLLHTDGRTLTWTPVDDEPNTNTTTTTTTKTKRRHHATNHKATPLDLATCSEVRHAWSPDPKCHGFTGTPILRSKCDAANAHKSFALVFPKRTVDITAVTADQCKVLMEGLSALIYRLQIAEMERTRLKLDEDHISTTLTGSSFTPSPIRTGSRREM